MWGRFQVKKWSAVELWYLIENYHKMSIEDLCRDLLKHEDQIEEQVHKLSLDKDPHGLWRPRGIFICQNPDCKQAFSTTKTEFKRSHGKYCSVNCTHFVQRKNIPSREILVDLYNGGMSINDLATHFHVSKGTVYNWFRHHDIETRTLSDSLREFFQTEKGYSAIKTRLNTLEEKYGTRVAPRTSTKGQYKGGLRKDLGVSVRSGWEANVLRWLSFQGRRFEYEPKLFIFEGIKKGNLSYLPDIYLPDEDIWIEIKGQLRPGDRVKINRFKKYYPNEFKKLRAIVRSENVVAAKYFCKIGVPILAYYRDLDRDFKKEIPHWE